MAVDHLQLTQRRRQLRQASRPFWLVSPFTNEAEAGL